MTYEEFATAYRSAFASMNRYSVNEVGSQIFLEKMVVLSDDYPEFLERFEAEEEVAHYGVAR